MRLVLVTGAAGGVGHRVSRQLQKHGFQVRALVRPGDVTRSLDLRPEDVRVGYVQDPAAVGDAMRGVDAVVHCAALLPDALHLGSGAFHEVNVEGTRVVMRQAMIHRPREVIAMSTISVVDHVGRRIMPPQLRQYARPTDPYVASKIEAEKVLFGMHADFAGQVIILRLAYVYGPGNFAVWRTPLRLLARGRLRLLGDGAASFPMIYADDVGKIVAAQVAHPQQAAPLRIHVLANPQPTTLRTVFDFVADHLGMARPGSVPVWMARLGAAVVGTLPHRWRRGRLSMLVPARVRALSQGYDLSAVLDTALLERIELTSCWEGLPVMLADWLAEEDTFRSP